MHFDKQGRFFVSHAAADFQTIYYTVRHFIYNSDCCPIKC